ncbi:14476_t:CDS:2 [Dentiscutata erythropus]|uniref:14476_t:CDS:1 n=1 Tax=Dentiscutata erythropus TaxID=1348616 RepID=A0A9N9G5Y5_9GLOM|nr:14476_t:CDS:2 [Dentiscutata erythropus]
MKLVLARKINGKKGWHITNHSCHRIAIQLLRNNELSESDLLAFSSYCSRESLADYYEYDNYKSSPVIEKYQEGLTEVTEALKVAEMNPKVTKDPKLAKVVKNHQKAKLISKPKSYDKKNASVMAPFKLPVKPNSPLFNSYGKKKRSLSDISNNIIIKLPTSILPQTYNLNINLKLS